MSDVFVSKQTTPLNIRAEQKTPVYFDRVA